MVDLIDKQLGAYNVEELIGKGGMAAVYKAYHPPTDRHVAIKVMLPDIATDATFQQRFEREAKTLAGLQHINILPVFDYGRQDSVSYLVMPYLPGKTLGDLLNERQLANHEISALFRQLAGAMDYAHSKGILHRDLKPDNVMLDEGGNALLADFGLTRLLDDAQNSAKLTSDSTVIGTPAYMSPEQGQGLPLDHRSDLYSLTVVLYEMLTGRVPYTAETPVAVIFKHISDPLPPPSSLRDILPAGVDAVVAKGMAKAPADRFESAAAIANALDAALANEPAPADVDTVVHHEKPKRPDGEMSTTQADKLAVDEAAYQPDGHAQTVLVTDDYRKPKRQPNRNRLMMLASMLLTLAVAGGGTFYYVGFSPRDDNSPDYVLPGHDDSILAMAVNGDGSQVLTSGGDERLFIWSLETGEILQEIEGHSADVFDVELHPNDQEAITSGREGESFTWDVSTGEMKIRNVDPGQPDYAYSTDGKMVAAVTHSTLSAPLFLSMSPDNQEAFEGSMIMPSLASLPMTVTHPANERFTALTFTPVITDDGETPDGRAITGYDLLTGDEVGNVYRWHLRIEDPFTSPEAIEAAFPTEAKSEYQMDLINLLVDYRYTSLEITDEARHGEDDYPITAITLDAQGERFATANEDGLVIIWSLANFDQTRIFPGSDYGAVYDIAFSPDGATLAIATEEVDILLYDVATSSITEELYTSGGDVMTLTYTPQGALIAGSDDGALYIWDFEGVLPF